MADNGHRLHDGFMVVVRDHANVACVAIRNPIKNRCAGLGMGAVLVLCPSGCDRDLY